MSKKLNPNAPAFKFNPDAAPFVPFSQQPPTIPIQHDPKPEKKEIQAPKPQFVKRELKKQSKQEEKQPKQEEKEAKQEKRQELDQSQTNQEKPETTPEQKIEDDDDDLEEAMRNVSLQAGETKLESEEDKDSEEIPSKVEEEDEFDDIEPSASVDQYKDIDAREHINVVFIGHVDSGKSTLSGQLLIQTGMVDSRMIDRYEREAKEKNRESWYLAFVMDAAEEERAKGKTIEVGRAKFETERKRYTLLDAPGHKSYVPNMIGGASQADVAILVISARRGEYETGFDRGGQTREHAMLAKTLGVQYLVVAINKMDEPTVQWSQERYNECVEGLRPFLKQSGFDLSAVYFLPVSGFTGHNILNKVSPDVCPWWERGSLIQTLDELPPMSFEQSQPFRMPIIDRYIDRGLMVLGKIEYGRMAIGDRLLVQPGRTQVRVSKIYQDETEVNAAVAGENIRVKLSGADDNTVQRGFVLSSRTDPCPAVKEFLCQLKILELPESRPILTAGYEAVLHIHTTTEEVTIVQLVSEINRKTGKSNPRPPTFVKSGAILVCKIELSQSVCMETFGDRPRLARFSLRDEGRTIAVGKVTQLVNTL